MSAKQDERISDYLDGRLDADERLRFESALALDPELREELRATALVRGLVSGLSRPPAGADLSGSVLSAIQNASNAEENRGPLRILRGLSPTFLRGIAVAAAAAALLAVASLPLLISRAFQTPENVLVLRPTPVRETNPEVRETNPTVEVTAEKDATTPQPLSDGALIALSPDEEELRLDEENEKFRRLLDSPSLKNVFLVVDHWGGEGADQVDRIIHDTPRRYANYVCIKLSRDLNPDPQRPGPASVYALVMDGEETDRLRKDLARALPAGSFEESEPNPDRVTRLADAGQVEVREGTPVAVLIDPQERAIASRVETEGAIQFRPDQAAFWMPFELMGSGPSLSPRAVFGKSSRKPRSKAADVVADKSGELSNDVIKPLVGPPKLGRPTSVVLVWVVQPEKAG